MNLINHLSLSAQANFLFSERFIYAGRQRVGVQTATQVEEEGIEEVEHNKSDVDVDSSIDRILGRMGSGEVIEGKNEIKEKIIKALLEKKDLSRSEKEWRRSPARLMKARKDTSTVLIEREEKSE